MNASPRLPRRRLMTADLVWLVGSAAIAMGLSELVWRGLVQGWFLIRARDLPAGRLVWRGPELIRYAGDLVILLIPVTAAWTVLLPMLRARPPRPSWRR